MDDLNADTESAEAGSSARKGPQDRSPNYPSLTFTEALECARKIWDKDRRHPVTKDVAAVHMGYSKASGATIPIMASLRRYGLMEPSGKELRITEDAQFIFLHEEDNDDRAEKIRQLAMKPVLFGDVIKRFGVPLPSDATLRAKLQHEWKFASSAAADTFIRALRHAVEIAGASAVAPPVSEVDTSGGLIKEPPMNTPSATAIRSAINPSPPPTVSTKAMAFGEGQTRLWDLGRGAVMTVVLPPGGLTQKNVARLKKYVAALEMEAQIAWDDGDDEGGDSPEDLGFGGP